MANLDEDQINQVKKLIVEQRKPTEIWLRVSNVRIQSEQGGDQVQVQVDGDRGDRPTWWDVVTPKPEEVFKLLLDVLDEKRIVLARLSWTDNRLQCTAYRTQLTDTASR